MPATPETLELVRTGPVLHVRLNRPDVRNAFDGRVVRELAAAVRDAEAEPEVRVLLLSGNGKSFCAGADLAWMQQQAAATPEQNEAGAREMAGMFLAVARCRKPVVARIHGHALGGGTGLTAAVDLAIAADDAVFGLTEVRLGIVPAVISPFVLQKIGAGRARRWFLTGERFDAATALRIGLVSEVVPLAALEARTDEVVAELLRAGPAAVASAKELIRTVAPLSLEEALPVTTRWIAELRATDEAREGMAAFLAKRAASWIR